MSTEPQEPVIYWPILIGGVGLMLGGYGLYRFFSPSPHGFLEIFFALPVFCFGLAFAGASFLTKAQGQFRPVRLSLGWLLLLAAASPILYLGWVLVG